MEGMCGGEKSTLGARGAQVRWVSIVHQPNRSWPPTNRAMRNVTKCGGSERTRTRVRADAGAMGSSKRLGTSQMMSFEVEVRRVMYNKLTDPCDGEQPSAKRQSDGAHQPSPRHMGRTVAAKSTTQATPTITIDRKMVFCCAGWTMQ